MLTAYRVSIGGLVASLALTLFALVDIRRGFLFAGYSVRTPFFVFTPIHALMLAAGLLGMVVCHKRSARLESQLPDASSYITRLGAVIFVLLVVDLFTYRGVPAARSIASGSVGVDWLRAFGVVGWMRPIAQATSYLLTVWHATMLGILISGLALTMLPRHLSSYWTRAGFTGSMLGAMFALPQPFCSCCSSVMAPSLARRGASTNFLLSFVIGAPMLNVTTMALAIALLPAPFAFTRITAGLFVSVVLTYAVSRIADRWDRPTVTMAQAESNNGWLYRVSEGYLRLFDLDRIAGGRGDTVATPSQLFSRWFRASGRIALVLVPTLWLWSVVAAAIFQMLPLSFGNNLSSVVLAAVAGTFFMISTWSEIPMALPLIQSGIEGPAAALLVVLPAISLPCMMLLGGSLRRFRLVGLLSAAVIIVGIVAGTMFL